jgi:hypothetical protein
MRPFQCKNIGSYFCSDLLKCNTMFSGKDKMFVLIRAARGCLFMCRIVVNIDYVIALIVFEIISLISVFVISMYLSMVSITTVYGHVEQYVSYIVTVSFIFNCWRTAEYINKAIDLPRVMRLSINI